MTHERLGDDPITAAQNFFPDLYRVVSGGPLDDDVETARLLLETNRHLANLVHGGIELSDGSTEATYEHLSGMGFVSVNQGELIVNQEDYVPQLCRIRYKEDGFMMDGSTDPIKWLVTFELAGSAHDELYLTTLGQAGHHEAGIFDPASEYSRNIVLIGNNLSMVFNNRAFVSRVS